MENIDIKQIKKNTLYLSDIFFQRGIKSYDNDNIIVIPERNCILKQAIEIIESKQYSKYELKRGLLEVHASEFWNDLFHLEKYEEAKIIIENSIKTEQAKFDTHPGKDDILLQDSFNRFMEQKRKDIDNLITIIELTNEFRGLLQVQIPDLETEFARLLIEHNDLQIKENAKIDERKNRKEKLFEKEKTTNDLRLNNELICDEKHLLKLYADFDDIIWKSVKLETFLDYMRVEPIGIIKRIDTNESLAIWLHENIEDNRFKNLVPNMGDWFKKLVGKEINYSTLIPKPEK